MDALEKCVFFKENTVMVLQLTCLNPVGLVEIRAISRPYSNLSCTNVSQVIKTDQTWSLRQSTRKEIINQICIHSMLGEQASKTLLDR